MSSFLWLGTMIGAAIGVVHAFHLYQQRQEVGGAGAGEAAWFALWAFAIWTLFGAYVLTFWALGAAGMAVWRLAGTGR